MQTLFALRQGYLTPSEALGILKERYVFIGVDSILEDGFLLEFLNKVPKDKDTKDKHGLKNFVSIFKLTAKELRPRLNPC
ncbi:MAG: hypothetical protein AAB516_01780 [Patescibacteria group bacterium]